jgi:TolA-binding protein
MASENTPMRSRLNAWILGNLLLGVVPIAHSNELVTAPQAQPPALRARVNSKSKTTKELPSLAAAPKEIILSDEQRDFTRAAELLKVGKESEAFISLTDYLRRYPTSHLAPEAQYLVADLFFKQRKFQEAAGEYAKVFRFGMLGVDKAPWASVKIGECWYQLKQFDRARIEWEAVKRKFPNSEASDAARAHLAGVPL